MTNREKFAEQILDIACNGNWMAVNKATLGANSVPRIAV